MDLKGWNSLRCFQGRRPPLCSTCIAKESGALSCTGAQGRRRRRRGAGQPARGAPGSFWLALRKFVLAIAWLISTLCLMPQLLLGNVHTNISGLSWLKEACEDMPLCI